MKPEDTYAIYIWLLAKDETPALYSDQIPATDLPKKVMQTLKSFDRIEIVKDTR